MNMHSSNKWTGMGLTDLGRVRKLNQDAFSIDNALQLWVLADGMGGHAGGEIAAQIAVETIPEYVRTHFPAPFPGPTPSELEKILGQAIESANQTIRKMAAQNAAIQGMGTTVVALAITHSDNRHQAVVAHVGDSRLYIFRHGELSLVTKDHSLMEERLALKLITPEEIPTHPLRHVLTKALGIDPQARPSMQTHPLEPTDLLLLCSDGLTKMLTDPEIQNRISKESPYLERIGESLITTANRLGGHDNTTIILIGLDSDGTWVSTLPTVS